MPVMNPKNMSLSPVASDLGLGDMLQQQAEDETEEMKKKKKMAAGVAGLGNVGSMGQAAMSLFGPNA